jgi:glycosyltransferase involved in cell wall biosynthesis
MKIVQLIPGSGNAFYCENCLRDKSLVKALRDQGHEVIVVPLYLPIVVDDEHCKPDTPVFFGGINVYLQQKLSFFRKTPRWIDRIFDLPFLLKYVAKMAGMTKAEELGDLTLSMLLGEKGYQVKEVERLTKWLKTVEKPDVVQFSDALLLGMAHQIKKELNVPLVCMLQDEDIWLDAIPDPQRSILWDTLAQRAEEVDVFIAVSSYFKQLMRDRLKIPSDRVHVIYNGIQTENYKQSDMTFDPPVIGFLERQCREKGLDILARAFIILKKDSRFQNVKLRLAGGMSPGDEPFVNGVRRQLTEANIINDVEFLPNLDNEERYEFLQSLSILSVPAEHKEAFGIYIIEALASGVPVVLPNHGAFPELMNITKGGIIYEPNEPQALANAIESLLLDPVYARELGSQGKKAVIENFAIEHTTRKFMEVIEKVAIIQ